MPIRIKHYEEKIKELEININNKKEILLNANSDLKHLVRYYEKKYKNNELKIDDTNILYIKNFINNKNTILFYSHKHELKINANGKSDYTDNEITMLLDMQVLKNDYIFINKSLKMLYFTDKISDELYLYNFHTYLENKIISKVEFLLSEELEINELLRTDKNNKIIDSDAVVNDKEKYNKFKKNNEYFGQQL